MKNKKSKKRYNLGVMVVLILILSYLIIALGYQNKFIPGTFINNVDASNKTVAQVNELLKNQLNTKDLTLVFRDGESETLSSSKLDLQYNENNGVEKLLKSQNYWGWIAGYFEETKQVVDDIVVADEKEMKKGIKTLAHLDAKKQIEPTDAYLEYKDGSFTIVEETYGSSINQEKLMEEVQIAFNQSKTEINLDELACYDMPKVKKDDKSLLSYKDAAMQYCMSSVTYKTPSNKTIVLDGATTMKWLKKQEDGTYIKDAATFEKKAKKWLNKQASAMQKVNSQLTFTSGDGTKRTLNYTTLGDAMDVESETKELLKILESNQSQTNRTPVYKHTNKENGGLGHLFVEVNITKQHLWVHQGDQIILESDFVSGNESLGHHTPSGLFKIYGKEKNRILRGRIMPNGEREYESFVNYWMPFRGGVGFHDASWRSKFGGQIYKTGGSHGCVNLPSSFAGQLYNTVKINTPVVVYR